MSRLQSVMLRSALAALSGREAGVARVGDEFVLQHSSPPEQPRPYGPDRDAQDLRGGLIRLILEIHQEHGRLEWLVELVERTAQRRAQVYPRQDLVATVANHLVVHGERAQRLEVAILQVHETFLTLPRPEKHVPSDREQPAACVASRLERM